jgi:hypothetical protein
MTMLLMEECGTVTVVVRKRITKDPFGRMETLIAESWGQTASEMGLNMTIEILTRLLGRSPRFQIGPQCNLVHAREDESRSQVEDHQIAESYLPNGGVR